MFNKLPLDRSWEFHNNFSMLMFAVIIILTFIGFYLQKRNKLDVIKKISFFIIIFCFFQEIIDYVHRAFLDPSYSISWQKDLPLRGHAHAKLVDAVAAATERKQQVVGQRGGVSRNEPQRARGVGVRRRRLCVGDRADARRPSTHPVADGHHREGVPRPRRRCD